MKVPKLGFTTQVFASIIAGAICGLFLGEKAQILSPIGDIFIKLMQITIIPSIVISIITGIGSINKADAKGFLKKVGLIMMLLWFLGIIVFFFMQLSFPTVPNNSFFSTTQLSRSDGTNFIELFIPSNPFKSLSEGLIPAIVLFCLLFGFSLIGDERNKPFVDLLKGISSTLSKITKLLMKTVPLGIFALTANTAGTITLGQFLQIQVFFVTTIVLSVILVLLGLPLLVYCFTPLGYRKILSAANKGVMLGFSTSHVFITLPLLSEGAANLFKDTRIEEEARSYSGILVPLAYSFPSLGAFVILLFIMFTAWFYNDPLELNDQIFLAMAGIPSIFGPAKLSIQFLLELMQLPADALRLYIISSPFHVYFVTALTCMSIFSFSTICTAFLSGCGGLRLKRALFSIIIVAAILSSVVLGLRLGFTSMLGDSPHWNETILNIKMPLDANGKKVDQLVETKVYKNYSDVPVVLDELLTLEDRNLMTKIRGRNVLRVGYNPDTMPFAFFNEDGDLVGYDIHMAYDLARVLNVSRIEFVPVNQSNLFDRVNNGSCDIIMSGIAMLPGLVEKAKFTSPHIGLHLAFVAKDDRKNDFEKLEDVVKMKDLKIAIGNDSECYKAAGIIFPLATIIRLDNSNQFFNQTNTAADVLLTTAETGSPMTLLHPFYDVAVLQPYDTNKIMCTYAVSKNCDDSSLWFLDYWLKMEKEYGSLDSKYNYWVLGENTENEPPRWSIIRDVLHWVE
ncbi:MAG: cation:dicarboxylase symporter family transporter [Methanotrichaceae archaeon]|nr:cation:dicarboxylase symporter family transporter [Methanotrichaceae archaeon]